MCCTVTLSPDYGRRVHADVDIKGANDAKGPWVSVLLKTGVFTGAGNHGKHPAALVVDTVADAVSAARHRQRSEYWHEMR